MKKIYVILIHVLLIINIIFYIYQTNLSKPKTIKSNDANISNNLLSMMIENDAGEYEESDNNEWPKEGYIFDSSRSKCENGGQINYQNNEVQVKTNSTDRCYVYFALDTMANKCELGYADANSAVCTILKTYGKDQNLYYHDGNSIDSNSDLEAGDNSYRYSGSDYEIVNKSKYQNVEDIIEITFNSNDWYNTYKLSYKESEEKRNLKEAVAEAINDGYLKDNPINNFVCIPSTIDNTCSNDNLYRIIGVFPNADGNYEVKLIKYDYATVAQIETGYDSNGLYMDNYKGSLNPDQISTYAWRDNTYDGYGDGDLNLNKLNGTFLSIIDSSKIADHTWYSSRYLTIYNAKKAYDTEVGSQKTQVGEELCTNNYTIIPCREEDLVIHSKIGLMYFSDYTYALKPIYWNNDNERLPQYILSNWFHMGHTELTITGYLFSPNKETYVILLNQVGQTGGTGTGYYYTLKNAIRPTFYLKSDVSFISGDGSYQNPYKLA